MKSILSEIRGALVSTIMLTTICCGFYPAAVWGVAHLAFKSKANGSLVRDAAGTIRGSTLIGQSFTSPKYFHPRPSAAGNGYDASSSGGSNLGPTSQKLRDRIKDRVDAYRAENNLAATVPVPADAAGPFQWSPRPARRGPASRHRRGRIRPGPSRSTARPAARRCHCHAICWLKTNYLRKSRAK